MTFQEWMTKNLSDYLPDIAEHGCAGGFPGLTYYSDTCALYEQHKDEIWDALIESAEGLGIPPMRLVSSFNGAESVYTDHEFQHLLVWYMAERIAREVIDSQEPA